MRARGLMARALPRRAKVSVRDRLRLPDGLRAFAQGSYIVSLRWRGGCPCGHHYKCCFAAKPHNRASPDGKQANRPGGDGNAPLFPRSGIGGGAALAASSRRLVFITVVPNAACTEILRCAQNDEKGGKVSEKSFFSGVARWRVRTGKGHFSRAEGAVLLFSRRRRVYILIAAKRRYHNPRPERPSNLRTLRPTARQT